MELFIAIAIEQSLAKQLCASTMDRVEGLAVEQPADLHITLRYIGHTERVNEIAERLTQVAFPDFSLRFRGYNAFVHPAPKDSVIWQGLSDPGGNLDQLRLAICNALSDILPAPKDEPFTPHITLAYTNESRIKQTRLPDTMPLEGVGFRVSSFTLSRVLPPQSPVRFRTIATYRLSEKTERRTVRLLCINDFHAALRENSGALGAAKLVRAVNDYKSKHADTAVLFGGDNFFGDPVSELYRGEPVLDVMRAVGAEASAAGNHDFDFSVEQFKAWQSDGGVPMLAANLVLNETGNPADLVRPYHVLRFGNIRIAVLGLAMQEDMDLPDRPKEWQTYRLTDGVAAAQRWMNILNAGGDPAGVPDAIFALTHFGLRETLDGRLAGEELERLVEEVPGLAGAFAAHFHRFVQFSAGRVAVAESGGTGKGFAVVALTFDRNRRLLSAVPLCYDLISEKDRLAEDDSIARRMDEYYEKAEREMGRTIAVALREMSHKDIVTNAIPLTGTPLTLLATQAMQRATGCPIALLYAGRIIGGFSKGPVSLYRFYQVFAFANVIVTARMSGRRIWENIQIGMRKLPEDGASPLAIGGLVVTIDPDRAAGDRVLDIRLSDGSKLDMDAFYPVVFEDYLASDPLGFRFSDSNALEYHEMTLRSLMLNDLERRNTLEGTLPDNILIQRSGI